MSPYCFLKIAPAANLAHERHLQPGGVGVIVIVGVRRRCDNERRPTVRQRQLSKNKFTIAARHPILRALKGPL